MATSKIIKANEKIAEGVTEGFTKMSDGVLNMKREWQHIKRRSDWRKTDDKESI
ncbi:MAG: hypothetical protein IJ608_06965 [Lachnospiraceae bacterium]|nr:hypothetical protein [Lachnospiraceae bacterium]